VLPRHRLGRVLIGLVLGTFLVVATLITNAPASQPEDSLPLAPAVEEREPTSDAVASDAVATPAPTPTRIIVTAESQFERALHALLIEAKRHRVANAAAEPTYWTRLDPRLNSTRLNFLLFGYGE